MYLLDTNTCIKILNGRPESQTQNVVRRFRAVEPRDIALCSIVRHELWYGALKSQRQQENLRKYSEFMRVYYSFGFGDAEAYKCGEIRSDLSKLGRPIGPYDVMIAAVALVNDLTLITANVDEFSRIQTIRMENWEL